VRATQGDRLGHLVRLQRLRPADCMTLDETAVRTLELLEASDGRAQLALRRAGRDGHADGRPHAAPVAAAAAARPGAIAARQDAVAALVDAPEARAPLRRCSSRSAISRG
jgi:DNA mismatch repair ATPase MutS